MKGLYLLSLITVLSGCASNNNAPDLNNLPYYEVRKLQKSPDKQAPKYYLDHRDNIFSIFKKYGLGVTEEKNTDRKYLVTVKLAKQNSLLQAKELAIYHGSTIAKESNVSIFSIRNIRQGNVCKGSIFQFQLEFIRAPKQYHPRMRLPYLMDTDDTIAILASKVTLLLNEERYTLKADAQSCKKHKSINNNDLNNLSSG